MRYLAGINRHAASVNVVRFSPDGRMLASGADKGTVLLWQRVDEPATLALGAAEDAVPDEENWRQIRLLRGHSDDVFDLCWARSGLELTTCSVDKSVIVWNTQTGELVRQQRDHEHFVQGVAVDPLDVLMASQSADRTVRVYGRRKGGMKKSLTIQRLAIHETTAAAASSAPGASVELEDAAAAEPPGAPGEEEAEGGAPAASSGAGTKKRRGFRMYSDESANTFFRRLAFSPDGALLVTPAGLYESADGSERVPTSYVFTRSSLPEPVLHLPVETSVVLGASGTVATNVTLCVRFCPVLFALRNATNLNFKLEHRMIFAVVTVNAVLLYDTEESHPIFLVQNMHPAALTDVAWSHDGRMLAISSMDGYVSLVLFDENELGTPLPSSVLERWLSSRSAAVAAAATDGAAGDGAGAAAAADDAATAANEAPASPESPMVLSAALPAVAADEAASSKRTATQAFGEAGAGETAPKAKKRIAPTLVSR